MKRSEHEAAILDHLSALAWSDKGGKDRTHRFVERIAGHFGIGLTEALPNRGDSRIGEDGWAQEYADGWFCPRWRGVKTVPIRRRSRAP